MNKNVENHLSHRYVFLDSIPFCLSCDKELYFRGGHLGVGPSTFFTTFLPLLLRIKKIMSLDENAVGKATTATYVENGETLTVGDRDLLRLKAFTEAYLAVLPVPSDTENPYPDVQDPTTRHAREVWAAGFAAGRAAALDEAALAQASVKGVAERAFAEGRAAAHPDPRVPSGLPIGYGGPTVKTDPVALLAQIEAIVDEPLDERDGHGPTRTGQFARIDALLRDVPPAASPDPPDEDAIRADERERLSARVYENGWCPTCAATPAASPDERLREAAAGRTVDWEGHIEECKRNGMLGTVNLLIRLAAADREAPDEARDA